jgi:hypothetical protein
VLALGLAGLVLAGCERNEAPAVECDAAESVEWRGDLYLAHSTSSPYLKAGSPVEGVQRVLCGDARRPQAARRVRGIAPAVALYPEIGVDTMYVNEGFPTELPDHPLHNFLYGSPDRPRRRDGGRRCRLDGVVTPIAFGIAIEVHSEEIDVGFDSRTRVRGFRRAGLPYFREGDRVRVHGRRCRDDRVLARRIEPQP